MRKGQGAMEYLMTYGWALIVIVVVIGALFALGILNPASYQQKRCSGLQYFTYVDQKLSASDYTMNVRNGALDVAIVSIKVGSAAADTAPTLSNTSALQAGDSFTIKTTSVPTVASGAAFNEQIVITYNVNDGITGNVDRATCVGTVA